MIPDVEVLVGAYLRQHPAIKALTAKVVGETPSDKSRCWVTVTQLDAPSVEGHRSDHLIEWMGQFDCYAGATGGQGEASLLTRTVREALRVMPESSFEGVVVTGARFLSAPRILDTDLEPARERYALTAVLWVHNS